MGEGVGRGRGRGTGGLVAVSVAVGYLLRCAWAVGAGAGARGGSGSGPGLTTFGGGVLRLLGIRLRLCPVVWDVLDFPRDGGWDVCLDGVVVDDRGGWDVKSSSDPDVGSETRRLRVEMGCAGGCCCCCCRRCCCC
jgi:hypothetical protein